MPNYNQVQTSRLENWAKRLLGVRNGGIVPTVAPELGLELSVPQLEDTLPLAGYVRFGWHQVQAAVAAQYAFGGINNRTASQLIGVQLSLTASVASRYVLVVYDAGVAFGALLGANSGNWHDTRRLHASFPLNANGFEIGTGTSVGAPPGAGNFAWGSRNVVGQTLYFPWVVLAPGSGCVVYDVVVNQTLEVSGNAWVRDILPDELTI